MNQNHETNRGYRGRRRFRRTAAGALAVTVAVGLFATLLCPTVHAEGRRNWYCVRTSDHSQPPADPRLEEVTAYGGYYIDRAHSDPHGEDRVVYLTFDVGYENGNVGRVLDALEEAGATGAFFVLGHVAKESPDLLRRMAAEGHLVCNHTYSHACLVGHPPAELESELRRLEDACAAAGVEVAPYFRPPEGAYDLPLLDTARRLGYSTVFWSFAYADWDNSRQPDPVAAKKKILDNIHNGGVLLLHPTSATNAAILGEVLAELKAMGYRFGTLDELTGGDGIG